MKVLEEAKISHEMVRKRGGGNRAVIVRVPVLSRCHSKIGPPADLVRGDR